MELNDINGQHLTAAYVRLYPNEMTPDQVGAFPKIFDAWLNHLRNGQYLHQISLGNNFTARKTYALLWLLQGDAPPPADLATLALLLNEQNDWRTRMQQRKDKLNPPQS